MIANPFRCEYCKHELQPEDVGIKIIGEGLVKICGFCGKEIKGERENESNN